MLEKIIYIETETEKYPLIFTLNVMEAVQEKYGSIEKWSNLIQNQGEPEIKALKFFITEAINEGLEIENGSQCAAPGGRCKRADEQEKAQRIANGGEQGDNAFDRKIHRKLITPKEAGRILTKIGLKEATKAVAITITEIVKIDKNSKNVQSTKSQTAN